MELFKGMRSVASRLPQYLMKAMFEQLIEVVFEPTFVLHRSLDSL